MTRHRKGARGGAETVVQGWDRSFPPGSVEGTAWVLDVLADLEAFADFRGLPEIEGLLASTRQGVHLALKRRGLDDDQPPDVCAKVEQLSDAREGRDGGAGAVPRRVD